MIEKTPLPAFLGWRIAHIAGMIAVCGLVTVVLASLFAQIPPRLPPSMAWIPWVAAGVGFLGSLVYVRKEAIRMSKEPYSPVPVGVRVPMPEAIHQLVDTSQPWRQEIAGKFLEGLKKQLAAEEKAFLDYNAMYAVVETDDHSPWAPHRLRRLKAGISHHREQMEALRERIQKIHNGDVEDEIRRVKVDISKLQLRTEDNAAKRTQQQEQLIDMKAGLEELESINYQHLHDELDLSLKPRIATIGHDTLGL